MRNYYESSKEKEARGTKVATFEYRERLYLTCASAGMQPSAFASSKTYLSMTARRVKLLDEVCSRCTCVAASSMSLCGGGREQEAAQSMQQTINLEG